MMVLNNYLFFLCDCMMISMWEYVFVFVFFFFKQKTAYEMLISDWSSDVCSSDLVVDHLLVFASRFLGSSLLRPCQLLGRPFGILQIGRASCRERVCQYV